MPTFPLRVRCEHTTWGEHVAVVGSWNAWKLNSAVSLTTTPGSFPVWVGTINVSEPIIEFKYVIVGPNGARWEAEGLPNRTFATRDQPDLFGEIPWTSLDEEVEGEKGEQEAASDVLDSFRVDFDIHGSNKHFDIEEPGQEQNLSGEEQGVQSSDEWTSSKEEDLKAESAPKLLYTAAHPAINLGSPEPHLSPLSTSPVRCHSTQSRASLSDIEAIAAENPSERTPLISRIKSHNLDLSTIQIPPYPESPVTETQSVVADSGEILMSPITAEKNIEGQYLSAKHHVHKNSGQTSEHCDDSVGMNCAVSESRRSGDVSKPLLSPDAVNCFDGIVPRKRRGTVAIIAVATISALAVVAFAMVTGTE